MTGVEYKARRIPCRLIIFDKDGTLIDFKATWIPLIRRRAAFLLKALGRDGEFEAFLLRSWGIDPFSGRIDPRGPTPVSSRSEEIIIGTVALYQHGYPWDTSKEWVTQAFDQADAATDRREQLRPIEGIQPLLASLKDGGFSLALATSDERKDTEAMLAALAMEGLFDSVICAGEVYPPKPHPETIFTLCRRLSIPPQEAICIGDSLADMMMGKKAGVALTIGILEGGVTTKEDLEKMADLVVDSIRDLTFF